MLRVAQGTASRAAECRASFPHRYATPDRRLTPSLLRTLPALWSLPLWTRRGARRRGRDRDPVPPPAIRSPRAAPVAPVNALLLTVFVGAVLVLFFVAFFLLQSAHGSERDALLPLVPDRAVLPPPAASTPSAAIAPDASAP